jgi:hypothetical protein
MKAERRIHIGTSGWHYSHWKGPFYPEDIPSKEMLDFYAKHTFGKMNLTKGFHGTKKTRFKKNPRTKFKDVGKMKKGQARREIEALREGIEHHDFLYYVKSKPAISDAVYDKLFHRLQELEEAFPDLQNREEKKGFPCRADALLAAPPCIGRVHIIFARPD